MMRAWFNTEPNRRTKEVHITFNKILTGALAARLVITVFGRDHRFRLARTDNADIKRVYTNLLNGSRRHLNASTRTSAGRGGGNNGRARHP